MLQLLRFVIVGMIGACVEVGLFSVMKSNGVKTITGNVVSFHIAFVICYFLHTFYTYRNIEAFRAISLNIFSKYAILMYVQLVVGSILLLILIDLLNWDGVYSKIVQISIVTPVGYIVQKKLIFKNQL